jgi:hypothetical protein
MEAMRQSWTDERLDDLNRNVDRRFAEVDRRFDEVDRRFDRVDERFDRVDDEFREMRVEMNARFDSLQRTMLQMSGLVVAALIGVIATQL